MEHELENRNFVKELDFTPTEMASLLALSAELEAARKGGTEERHLVGKNIALLFEKTSTRTRSAFEVAAFDQGAHVTYLDPSGSQMGHKESTADTARVIGRMYDGIQYRGSKQADIEVLAEHAGVPVYNGLTDEWHPTQMLADFLTMQEHTDKPLNEVSYAFLGDLRFNLARSHAVMAALMGSDVRLCGPAELSPPDDVIDAARAIAAQTGATITVTEDVAEAVDGVDFVHTDVWVSMGEPKDVWTSRVELLKPYQVTSEMMGAAGAGAKFLHCLPAFHDANTTVGGQIMEHTNMPDGLEVTHEVFESEASVVFDQAENRLHTIKAVLVATLS